MIVGAFGAAKRVEGATSPPPECDDLNCGAPAVALDEGVDGEPTPRCAEHRVHRASEYTEGGELIRWWRFGGLEYRSDLIAGDYMRRWMVRWSGGAVRLHRILRSDADDCYHDHQMDFASLILRGGYVEHTPYDPPLVRRPGDVVFRRAEDLHRVELIDGPALTLLLTSPKRRDWGFSTPDGWVPAGQFDAWKRRRAGR